MKKRQTGAAILVALITVALVATIAGALLSEQDQWHRQVSLQSDRMQATALAQAGVHYAMAILADDARTGNSDHGSEAWARPLPAMSVEGGLLAGRIVDLQGRVNLNDAGSFAAGGDHADKALARLFRLLELPPALLDTLGDWIDADDQPRDAGAEDAYYASLDHAYRSAGRPLASIEELNYVRGFDAAIIERLRPFVAALPVGTAINLNTASATVLHAAVANMDARQALELRTSGDLRPFTSVADFVGRLEAFSVTPSPMDGRDVSSKWFEIIGDVRWGEAFSRMQVIVERQTGSRMPRIVSSSVQ